MSLVYLDDNNPFYVNPYFVSSYINYPSHLGPYASDLFTPKVDIKKTVTVYDNNKTSVRYDIDTPLSPRIIVPPELEYPNVNNDPRLLKRVYKYFYEKTMNDWLYGEFRELLKYLVYKDNRVDMVSNELEMKQNPSDNNMEIMTKKIEFISKYVMSKYDMKNFIKKYAKKSNIDLWDLKKYKSYVKKSIYKTLKNHLEKIMLKL